MQKLIEEFNDMRQMPIFEIEINGDYYIYYIQADKRGIHAGHYYNNGFCGKEGLSVQWCQSSSLDEHLEALYELCIEDVYSV